MQQLAGHTGADDVDAAVIESVAQRLPDLQHDRLLRLLATGLLGDLDLRSVRAAEFLELNVAEAEPGERRPRLGDVDRADLGLDLHPGAADEVDAEIEPHREIERDGENRQDRRDRKTDPAKANEIETGVVRDDAEQAEMEAHF